MIPMETHWSDTSLRATHSLPATGCNFHAVCQAASASTQYLDPMSTACQNSSSSPPLRWDHDDINMNEQEWRESILLPTASHIRVQYVPNSGPVPQTCRIPLYMFMCMYVSVSAMSVYAMYVYDICLSM